MLAAGDPLVEVQREAERSLAFVQNARFRGVTDFIASPLALVRMLRGLTRRFGSLDGDEFDEAHFVHRLSSNPNLAMCECWYWIRKLQGCFLAGDYATAVEASSEARRLLWTAPSLLETAEYYFYAALSCAAACEAASADQREKHVDALAGHHRQLRIWEANCPENFQNRAALVGAEIARLEGCPLEAMELYERAIATARANGFVHHEALAYELAARFYAARGFEEVANLYLGNARRGYLRWGADGKVRQLDELHPRLRQDERARAPAGTIEAPVEHLDLATMIDVSQALSGEMVLEKVIDKLMRAALEHAGAERGLLIIPRGDELQIHVEAIAVGEDVILHPRDGSCSTAALPESLVRYGTRTQETVILDDASSQHAFSADPYILQSPVRSILCLPLINQGKLTGILYLENNLAPKVFTPDRVALLQVLASQAAISLENSRLYRDLADREGKIRESERSLRAAIDGIPGLVASLTPNGYVEALNRQIVEYCGRSLEELKNWGTDGTIHPDDLPHVTEVFKRSIASGVTYKSETRFRRFDGEYRWFDVRGVPIRDDSGRITRWYFLLTDVEDRTEALARLQQMQSDFAHINRVSTMGELAASLSHEILHPIATARNNARAGMRFLEMNPPNLGEVGEALACVVRDADRARDIVGRMRDHIKKAPPRKERFDLNEAINEVIVLSQSVTHKNGVLVQIRLADGLLPVLGDRIQVQQVLLNLILNAAEAMGSVEVGARELLISTEQDQAGALVAVRDSGPGIDPADPDRVFDAFYTTKASGMGMGLSICRSIIHAHGGKLWAEANEPHGAAFQFTLPGTEESS
jgi:PAS domain S-box-containing protein